MRLRFLIFLTFSSVAVLPVLALAAWIFTDALNQEMESVKDKHLVIARNVGEALERYSVDLRNGFKLVSDLPAAGLNTPTTQDFLKSLDFVHFCIAHVATGRIVTSVTGSGPSCPPYVPADRFKLFLSLLDGTKVVFSPVKQGPAGDPVLYLMRQQGQRLSFASVSTRYIVKQGTAVSFGEKGHAAIVDQIGQVIAHPLPAWRKAIKNIAKVAPVQRMMARETGTMVFYSPALKADMVSGYTFVPTPGWGVMIPQPLSEIRSAAIKIQNSAIGIAVAGIVAAAILSWFLSGFITRPLSSVVRTARRMAAGDFDARVETNEGLKPKEFRNLAVSFNAMAEEISKTHRDLSQAVIEADTANRVKSEFLATMSHDLRTPLNAIIGFSDAMRSKIFGPLGHDRYYEYLADIEQSGKLLLSLIDDILDLSKIEAGRYELRESDVKLDDFLSNTVDLADFQARRNGVVLELSIEPGLPQLFCDERTLTQITNNLLSNAIKFSHTGGLVQVSAHNGPAGTLEIVFADQGIGMTTDEIDEVLEPFSQVDSRKTRQYQGTGLGLPICQKFMELHGGMLQIESQPGVGTTAVIRFPASRVLTEATIQQAIAASRIG